MRLNYATCSKHGQFTVPAGEVYGDTKNSQRVYFTYCHIVVAREERENMFGGAKTMFNIECREQVRVRTVKTTYDKYWPNSQRLYS